MGWIIGGIAVALLVGCAVWFLAPTLRTVKHADFEPAPKDDASVERANQSWTIDGGGGGV